MDYHFLRPRESKARGVFGGGGIMKIITRFLPLFVLAAFLPFLVGFVLRPPDISFFTRADDATTLRIWVEPANALMSTGKSAGFTIMAQYDGENKLIPSVTLDLVASDGVSLSESSIVYDTPFSGKTTLGTVEVTARERGSATVGISRESVVVSAFDSPLNINTGEANITVR